MQFASLYLNFNGNAEEAFEHYRSIFGGEYEGVLRFRDFGEDAMGAAESELDKIAHISLPLVEGISLMASDVIGAQADDFNAGNNVYI
jgi:PhnB protein